MNPHFFGLKAVRGLLLAGSGLVWVRGRKSLGFACVSSPRGMGLALVLRLGGLDPNTVEQKS